MDIFYRGKKKGTGEDVKKKKGKEFLRLETQCDVDITCAINSSNSNEKSK